MEEQTIQQVQVEVQMSLADSKEKRKEYMRNYMRNRYQQDPVKGSQYRNSCRSKAKNGVSAEDSTKYGLYLPDIIKLKKILAVVPRHHIEDVITETYRPVEEETRQQDQETNEKKENK